MQMAKDRPPSPTLALAVVYLPACTHYNDDDYAHNNAFQLMMS